MSTDYREDNHLTSTSSRNNMSRSISRTFSNRSIPRNAPIEPGHSMATGMQMVSHQVEEDRHRDEAGVKDNDDEYGHLFVMKRLRRDMPLPGRWTLFVML
jgi:hypothetical protein